VLRVCIGATVTIGISHPSVDGFIANVFFYLLFIIKVFLLDFKRVLVFVKIVNVLDSLIELTNHVEKYWDILRLSKQMKEDSFGFWAGSHRPITIKIMLIL